MKNIPALNARKVIRALEKAGFVFLRQKGSHRIYDKSGRLVVVPYHNRDLKKPTVLAIIEQSGLSIDEFFAVFEWSKNPIKPIIHSS